MIRHALRIGGNAVASLGPQILALLVLDPAGFGVFSIPYLIYALGSSLAISLVVDPWLMSGAQTLERPSQRRGFAAITLLLATLVAALSGVIVAVLLHDMVAALLSSVAAGASTVRSAERARATDVGSVRGVLGGDLAATIALAASVAIFVAIDGEMTLVPIIASWCASAVASLLPSLPELRPSLADGSLWIRQHRRALPRLVADSLLMDAGAIGTPFVLAGILGVHALGVYRAISNVAAPVRLILAPLRPSLARTAWDRTRVTAVAAASVLLGVLACGALVLIDTTGWQIGTLTAVASLAAPTGLFVAANFCGHAAYVVARVRSTTRALLAGRAFQTVTALAAPILGGSFAGVPGAAWGLAGATVASAFVWVVLARRASGNGTARAQIAR